MILRYYNLISHSEEVLSSLEKNILGTITVPTSPKSDFSEREASPLPAEVLYRFLVETNPGKEGGWFSKGILPTYKKELVLRLDENHVHLVDRYLYSLALEVEEARNVSHAALTFATPPTHSEFNVNYKIILEDHIKVNYPNVLVKVEVSKNAEWEKKVGDICQGKFSGSAEDIIELNHFLSGGGGLGMHTKCKKITFFYGNNGRYNNND